MIGELTLGPLLYHWPVAAWRDFYLRMADEAPVDAVYLGEVVCPKRWPLQADFLPGVLERLERAGKTVILSTPALVVDEHDVALLRALAGEGRLVEINDVAAFELVDGGRYVLGPYVNLYNESALACLAEQGAMRATAPVELPADSLAVLARQDRLEVEVHAFGRWPLAISARCYHARAQGRTKATCQYACGDDAEGLTVTTLDGDPFLTVNGVQTQSHAFACLLHELRGLRAAGIAGFRLSPQDVDMVAVARLYRDVLDGTLEPEAALARLCALLGDRPLANGFHHQQPGVAWVAPVKDGVPGRDPSPSDSRGR